ncbi:uncharacterized protein LOC119677408 [Teleopsis dalmanni]|uniref:uncharacterized protein LOC119677408 n=1 Tax=Teleopsis dalmanni TaxID=139649 RepID=UPI0018CDF29D|nr:uncharacterized protein LOC119677408 [Teleopsis dalmanni]
MIKVFNDKKELIYLNHETLIEDSYVDYKLKHELFNFSDKKPKHTEEGTNDNLATKPDVKENNKLKRTKCICLTNEMSALDQDCKQFLAKLKTAITFPTFSSECELPHYWDEAMNFPKFHGENNTATLAGAMSI